MYVELEFVKSFLLALGLGFMVGLQREVFFHNRSSKREFIGVRSFSIIAILGYLSAHIQETIPYFMPIAFIIAALLLIVSYTIRSLENKKSGTTTEFSALLTFLVGAIVWHQEWMMAIFIVVSLIILLEIREWLQNFTNRIHQEEARATALFLMIAFIILPILPNETVDPYDIFNPYTVWLMVVLISGLSFAGYIAARVIGASRGIIVTGFVGGFVSSTATTITFSKKAKQNPELVPQLASGIALACTTMFFRVIILVAAIHPPLIEYIAPSFLVGTLAGYGYIFYLQYTIKPKNAKSDMIFKNPLELKSSIKIGIVFGVIFGITSLFQQWLGDVGVYISSVVAGLTDVDAIVVSLSQLSSESKLALDVTVIGIILASFANSAVKLAIGFIMGSKALGWKLVPAFAIPLGSIISVYLVMYYFKMM